MMDLHCHLLPGIDDGPDTLEIALEMCRQAVKNGIRKAVTTPHIIPGRYENDITTITKAWKELKQELNEAGISLELGMAAEVRLDPIVMEMIKTNRIPFLGAINDSPLLLLEFPHTHIPPGSEEFIAWLMQRGIRTMIAHPERNGAILISLKKLEPFVKLGCLFQITAGSLQGVFGAAVKKRGLQMLKNNLVTIIASDAHDLYQRLPDMEPGRQVAARIVGEVKSWELVRDRPAEIAAAHFIGHE